MMNQVRAKRLPGALAALTLLAWFHVGTAQAAQDPLQEISCDNAPATATRQIPTPLDTFARVVCTNYGHILTSAQGMMWAVLNDGGGQMPMLLAQADGELRTMGHEAHFTSIKLVELPMEEQIRMMTNLKNHLPLGEKFDGKVMLLHIRANTQAVHRLFFFVVSQGENKPSNLFGMICSPDCDISEGSPQGKPFVVLRIPPQPQPLSPTGGASASATKTPETKNDAVKASAPTEPAAKKPADTPKGKPKDEATPAPAREKSL